MPVQTLSISAPSELVPLKNALAKRFLRHGVSCRNGMDFTLDLSISARLGEDTFRIAHEPQKIRLEGGSLSALVCGAGRILHESAYSDAGMVPYASEGVFTPQKSFRGIYFATHFHNWYHAAPEDEVREYIIDLALWGYNTLVFWLDLHHFSSFDCEECVRFRERLIRFAETACSFGMKTAVIKVVNEAFDSSPAELRAVCKTRRGGWYDSQVCPSTEQGLQYLLDLNGRVCRDFYSKLHLSYIGFWPYDQGGCDCEKCSPWALNGYLRLTRELKRQINTLLPDVRTILSTWFFQPEEMALLADFLQHEPEFCDYVICGWNAFEKPVPGIREIDFPEISMNTLPWGAFGANPQPERFQREWDARKAHSDGGYPYSEGFFEDINKVLFSQFYCWDTPAAETLKLYASYEFGAGQADEIVRLIEQIGQSHDLVPRPYPSADRKAAPDDVVQRFQCILQLAEQIDARLPAHVRANRLWRILYLRTYMNLQYAKSGGAVTPATDEAAAELIRLYHAENAHYTLRPVLSSDQDIERFLF